MIIFDGAWMHVERRIYVIVESMNMLIVNDYIDKFSCCGQWFLETRIFHGIKSVLMFIPTNLTNVSVESSL